MTPDQEYLARIRPVDQLDEQDLDRWRALARRAIEGHPFGEPEFVLPGARHLAAPGEIRVATVERGDVWVASLVLAPARRWKRSPLVLLSTAGHAVAEHSTSHGPLLDERYARPAMAALLRHLGTSRTPGHLLEITQLRGDGPLGDVLRGALDDTGRPWTTYDETERGVVPGGMTLDEWRGGLTRNRRRLLARRRRGLEEQLGAPLTAVERGHEDDAAERFLALEAAGWKGDPTRGGTFVLDDAWATWFREAVSGFQRRGAFGLQCLEAGGTVVAMDATFRSGGRWFLLLDAYDERFASFSPGLLGRAINVEGFLGTPGAELYDSCQHPRFTENQSLYPERHSVVTLLVSTRGPVASSAVRLLPRARALSSRARDAWSGRRRRATRSDQSVPADR